MKTLKTLLIVLLTGIAIVLVMSSLTQTKKENPSDKTQDSLWLMNQQSVLAVLYQQKSGEYRALCYQAMEMARLRLEEDSKRGQSLRPKAIILDIDETVLDNSPYQAECILKNKAYPALWTEWVLKSRAAAVPGVIKLLKYADRKGYAIFYVTNREEKEKKATLHNLDSLGIPAVAENLLMKTSGSGKEGRRNSIESRYQVVMYIGDNLNDFTDAFEKKTPEQRMHITDSLSNLFGKRYIILPNPMYGDWESALFGYQYSKSPLTRVQERYPQLQGF